MAEETVTLSETLALLQHVDNLYALDHYTTMVEANLTDGVAPHQLPSANGHHIEVSTKCRATCNYCGKKFTWHFDAFVDLVKCDLSVSVSMDEISISATTLDHKYSSTTTVKTGHITVADVLVELATQIPNYNNKKFEVDVMDRAKVVMALKHLEAILKKTKTRLIRLSDANSYIIIPNRVKVEDIDGPFAADFHFADAKCYTPIKLPYINKCQYLGYRCALAIKKRKPRRTK